mmetsp:Transcript_44791/g.108205  ORF Transcript_44791/g.108205 Transcript_44791/m.108205 type:complete len:155 (-) Transcript_44791:1126-1590(-)
MKPSPNVIQNLHGCPTMTDECVYQHCRCKRKQELGQRYQVVYKRGSFFTIHPASILIFSGCDLFRLTNTRTTTLQFKTKISTKIRSDSQLYHNSQSLQQRPSRSQTYCTRPCLTAPPTLQSHGNATKEACQTPSQLSSKTQVSCENPKTFREPK